MMYSQAIGTFGRVISFCCSLLLVLAATFGGVEQAKAKVTLDTSGKGELVALQGDISGDDVAAFKRLVDSKQIKLPLLLLEDSNGGDANAAMDLGRIVRANHFTVWAMDRCLSACALVYIAGVERQNFGVIGLHRPYLAGVPTPTALVGAATQKMLANIKAYTTEMNITDEFDNIMVNTAPESMRTYFKGEVETLVPARDPLYDELLTAYGARVYGVSTEVYRQRDTKARSTCNDSGPSDVAGITAGQFCALATRWGMTVPNFEPRYKLAVQLCGTVEGANQLNLQASNWDNPELIQNENCVRKVMLSAEKTVSFVIKPQFKLALSFHEGLAVVEDGYFHTGFIDKQGKSVIPPRFINAGSFQDGLAAAQVADGKTDKYGSPTGKWGVIDRQGRFVIKPIFSAFGGTFQNGLASVEIGDKWGFINKLGEFVIQPRFDWAGSFQDGLAPVNVAQKWGFIDTQGKFIISPQFQRAHEFQDGLAAVAVADRSGVEKWGFIDKQGKIAIKPQFDQVEPFQEGLSAVGFANNGWKWGFVDKQGKFVVNPIFDWATSFQDGLAAVNADDKWGFINKQGGFVIRPQFEWADSYREGLARVQVDNKWGYISE